MICVLNNHNEEKNFNLLLVLFRLGGVVNSLLGPKLLLQQNLSKTLWLLLA